MTETLKDASLFGLNRTDFSLYLFNASAAQAALLWVILLEFFA